MRKIILVCLFLIVCGCALPPWNPTPTPTPTPKPTPTPIDCKKFERAVETACIGGESLTQECRDAQAAWLDSPCSFDPVPDPVCDPNVGLVTECWHRPPGEHWQWIPKKVTPEPTPDPDPPAVPLLVDENLVADPNDRLRETFQLTHEAVGRWRDKHPEKWRADGACLIDGPAGIDHAFGAIAAELGSVSTRAGQSVDRNGKRSDALFVFRQASVRAEETHLFDYTRGCVSTSAGSIKMVYIYKGETAEGCTDPQPPELLKINVKYEKSKKWPFDGTPKVLGFEYKGPGTNYCRDIGFESMPGQPGVEMRICPLGNEDNPTRRMACERKVLDGAAKWNSDGTVEVNPDNHLLARCSNCTWIEVCHSNGTKCTRVSV